MPELSTLLLVFLLCGVLTAGVTQLLKASVRPLVQQDKKIKPKWWRPVFMAVPMLVGAPLGALFFSWPWGVAVGSSAGVLSAVVYNRARVLVKGLALPNVPASPPSSTPEPPVSEDETKDDKWETD